MRGVDRLLEHPLLVVHDDLGRPEVEQSLQAVVAVDDAAVIVNNIAPVAIGGVLLLWTIRYAKRNGVHLEFLGPAPEPVPVRVSARS